MSDDLMRAALPDPGKLIALADWLDLKYPEEMGTGEVQADLRDWAWRAAARLGMTTIPKPPILTTDERIAALKAERDALRGEVAAANERYEAQVERLKDAIERAKDVACP